MLWLSSYKMFRWFWPLAPHDELDSLPDAQQTRRYLQRERLRADRTGTPFSVLSFDAVTAEGGRESLRWVVRYLKQRLRVTDEIGWLEEGRLCAILPVTPADGAVTVARDVTSNFPSGMPAIACQLYSYPTATVPDDAKPASSNEPQPLPLTELFFAPLPTWKRTLDILGSGLGLILLSPLLLGIALLIRLSSAGPALFRQRRAGVGGRPFTVYKFRTMVTDAERLKAQLMNHNEQDGPAFKMKNDPRITTIGRFLRATSLDELPQLLNVFFGDMSIVGPRPLPLAESDGCASWQQERLDTVPGITCIWQVHGRCRVPFTEWMRMDIRYARNRTLWGDLKLIVQTIPAVLFQRGAH